MYSIRAPGPGEPLSIRRIPEEAGPRADLERMIPGFERGGPWHKLACTYSNVILESVDELADYCRQKRVMLRTDPRSWPRRLIVHKYHEDGEFSSTIAALDASGGDAFLWLGDDAIGRFNELMGDDQGVHRRITDWPITRAFLYLDVSDFSQLTHRK